MGGELGHVHLSTAGLLESDQPTPLCNCGFEGDAESCASLKGIELNLLPDWLTRYPDHPLHAVGDSTKAAMSMRGLAEQGDPMALGIFRQQAMALGRLLTVSSNFIDAHAYFIGGGVIEAAPHFRNWFIKVVSEHTVLRGAAASRDYLRSSRHRHGGRTGFRIRSLARTWWRVTEAGSRRSPCPRRPPSVQLRGGDTPRRRFSVGLSPGRLPVRNT